MQGWINLNDIAWWSKMSLEMHLCLKEWSHFGPFQGIQKRFDGEQETYQNDKKNRPYIILFGNLLSLSCSSRFLASKHGVFVPSGQIQNPESKGPLFWQWTLLSHLVRMQCSSGGTRSVSLYSGHSFVVSLSRERWNYLKATSTRIRIFLKPFFRPF